MGYRYVRTVLFRVYWFSNRIWIFSKHIYSGYLQVYFYIKKQTFSNNTLFKCSYQFASSAVTTIYLATSRQVDPLTYNKMFHKNLFSIEVSKRIQLICNIWRCFLWYCESEFAWLGLFLNRIIFPPLMQSHFQSRNTPH
jgi:hypothetical protein